MKIKKRQMRWKNSASAIFFDGKILHPAGTVAKSLSAAVTAAMVAVSLSTAVAIAIAAARIWAVRITGAVT